MTMEKDNMTPGAAEHSLMLEGRSRAKLAGVTAVSCFNDQEIVLETSQGELALLGENQHIEQMNLENGRLEVTGSIFGFEYSERAARERRGLFSRRRK
jgi:sporulation protein YabP